MRKFFYHTVFWFLRLTIFRNPKFYYDKYYGSDNILGLIIKNLVNPTRFLRKAAYGQVVRLPVSISKGSVAHEVPELCDEWNRHLEVLRQDGIVFVPGLFEDLAAELRARYQINTDRYPGGSKYYRFSPQASDLNVLDIMVSPLILSILAKYYGRQPYHRHRPGINCTHPGSNTHVDPGGFNDFWHYDTANQMTAHILLTDTSDADNCMLYARGSHRKHREYISGLDYYYSEEYMRANFDIVSCVGRAGTLILFDSNGLHRVDLKPDTFRSHLHLNFVPGNNFLDLPAESTDSNANFEAKMGVLKRYQRDSLVHLRK